MDTNNWKQFDTDKKLTEIWKINDKGEPNHEIILSLSQVKIILSAFKELDVEKTDVLIFKDTLFLEVRNLGEQHKYWLHKPKIIYQKMEV